MIVRSAALLAALTLLPAPAFAQDSAEAAPPAADAPAEGPPAEAPPPAEASPAAAAPALPEVAPAADAPAADAPAADAPAADAPAADAPAPAPAGAAAPAPAPTPPVMQPAPPSPFTPDQRAAWLNQCRRTFQQAGAPLGGLNGLPDACDSQLLDFERNYVPSPDGAPPTIWVRVPRTPAIAPAASPAIDGDVE